MTNPNDVGLLSDTIDNKEFVKSKRCYYEIKQIFLDFIPETHFPTYEEWVELVNKDELHQPTTVDFVPGSLPRAGAAVAGFAGKVGMEAIKASGLNADTADNVLNSMRNAAEAKIRQRINQTKSKIFESFSDTGDGGTSETNYLGGSRFNPTGLSQTLKPIDTSFRTDIEFQGQTRYWQDGDENSGPLFIKTGVPGLISNNDDENRDPQIWDFVSGPLTMQWNTTIANKVTWTGRVKDIMTKVKISDYINRCLSVCSVYYFWRSIISFTDDPRNRNAGMDAIRDRLTPDDYNNLWNLRREMMQSAIPPFIHEFCFYMFGTYRQNHLPTSPIMKIMPFPFATSTGSYFTGQAAIFNGQTYVDQARGHLNQLKEFNNVLSKALGDWGGIEPFEYTSSPRVDFNYTTFWTNASYRATNDTGYVDLPRIQEPNDELVYNIHTDAPDGWISALVSPLVVSTTAHGVGLFHCWRLSPDGLAVFSATSTYDTNKITSCFMYNADSTPGFYPVETAQTYQCLSGNTYTTKLTAGTYHAFQKFGTERVILTSINALRQANFQMLDLIYTQDLRNIGKSSGIRQGKLVTASDADKNPYGGRKRGKRRNKSKSSKKDGSMKEEL